MQPSSQSMPWTCPLLAKVPSYPVLFIYASLFCDKLNFLGKNSKYAVLIPAGTMLYMRSVGFIPLA